MALYRPLPFVHNILQKHIHPQASVIDATLGNGNDAAMIVSLLSYSGKFFGFDVQQQAINNTAHKLKTLNPSCNYKLMHQAHETMLPTLNEYKGKIDCVLFNLGYLPHGNQNLTTKVNTTYTAILQALTLLKQKGILIVVTYPGHANGAIEHAWLSHLFTAAPATTYFITTYYQFNNKRNPPHVFLIEKRNTPD